MKKPSPTLQRRMLNEILKRFPVRSWAGSITPFEALVETILSQNTNDSNRDRAMKRLRARFRITPGALAEAPIAQMVHCIRPAGLYRVKAPRIKEISNIILEHFGGDLGSVLRRPTAKARAALLELPGVGYKTADVLLAFVADHPTVPVDTHVMRISKRLGIVSERAAYEETRLAIERLVSEKHRVRMHLSLIRFGREICKAPRPRCPSCPLKSYCPSSTVRSNRSLDILGRTY